MPSWKPPTPDHPDNNASTHIANARVRKSRWSVERHPRFDDLVRDLVACRKSAADIAKEYKVPVETLRTYQRTVLADAIREAGREKARRAISEGLEEVNTQVKRLIKNPQRQDTAQLIAEHRNNLVLYGNIHGVIGQAGVADPLNPNQPNPNVYVDLRQINAFPDMCDYTNTKGVAPSRASDLVLALPEPEEEFESDSAEEFEFEDESVGLSARGEEPDSGEEEDN